MGIKQNKFQKDNYIFSEGNKGADFIEISNLEDGTVHLRAGSCCVMIMDRVVPVEFLTGLLQAAMLENNFNVDSIIDKFTWSDSYKEELKSKVK